MSAWVRSNMWRDERPVATGLDQSFSVFKYLQKHGNWQLNWPQMWATATGKRLDLQTLAKYSEWNLLSPDNHIICISWNLRGDCRHWCSHKDECVHVCSFCGSKNYNAFSWTCCSQPSNWCICPSVAFTSSLLLRFLLLNHPLTSFIWHLSWRISLIQQDPTPLQHWHVWIFIAQAPPFQ